MKKMNYIAVALSAFFVGCATYTAPDEKYEAATHDMGSVKVLRDEKTRYISGRLENRIYVEQVKTEQANKPSWFYKQKSYGVAAAPFAMAMADLLSGEPVQSKGLDNVDSSFPVSIQGTKTIGEALDAIAASTGYSYTIDKNIIVWSKYESAYFDIPMFAGEESFNIGKGGKSEEASGDGFSSIEQVKSSISANEEFVNLTGEIDTVSDIENTLKSMKTKDGKIFVNRSVMSVHVEDTPVAVARMRKFMNEYAEQMMKLVAIEISIVNVELNDQTSLMWDLKPVAKDLADHGFSLGSSGSMGDTAETASSIFTLTRTKGDWTGTQALMQALKSVGSVSNRTLPRTTTMSNRAVKLRNINRTNFILERTMTTTANVGTEGSITQGTVQTGFSLYAIPKIYGTEDVILRVTTNLSTLLGLDKKSSSSDDGSTNSSSQSVYVEAPRVQDTDYDNTVVIRNGDTLVLAGLTSESSMSTNKNAGADVLGLNKTSEGKHLETLLLITPTILRGAR